MGIKLPILVYTHTDMKDVWSMFFGQLKKYMPNNEIYVCVNEDDETLLDYNRIIYDDSKTYTERLTECLEQLKEEVFLFTHEDMILFDTPNYEYLEKYTSYINERKVESIKLIYAGDEEGIKSECDETLIFNSYSKFSIQPTIIRKDVLLTTVSGVGKLNIWDFENAIVGAGMDFMARRGDENRRGLYHYDSFVYPYIATAINKGKWNYNEYQKELDLLFGEYNINPFERGIA